MNFRPSLSERHPIIGGLIWGTLQILFCIALVVALPFLCSLADTETPEARAQLAAAHARDIEARRVFAARIKALGRRRA